MVTNLTWWAVILFISLQPEHVFIDACIGAGAGEVKCCCSSNRTDFQYIWMREVVGYEYRLSTMLGRLLRSICQGDRAQDLVTSYFDLVCVAYPYPTAWICVTWFYWHAKLDFEHLLCVRVPRRVFVGWQIKKMYARCPVERSHYYVFNLWGSWEGLLTIRLLLKPTTTICFYYNNLILDGELRSLNCTVFRAVSAVCTAAQLLSFTIWCVQKLTSKARYFFFLIASSASRTVKQN